MYEAPFHLQDISRSSFLITGGAGFIGSHLVEYLVKYNAGKIIILDDLSTGNLLNIKPFLKQNVELINGDIRDLKVCENACKKIDFVLHQAALGSIPRSVANPVTTHEVNSNGFVNMLWSAHKAKVKRFVYASSSSVYGDSKDLPKIEDNIGKPLSPYGVSKLNNEQYANVFSKTYKMPVIGLRYFNIFGPRQSPSGAYAAAIPLFMDGLLNNKKVYINGNGEQSRDFTFVENAVQANIKALFVEDDNIFGQVFNIAVGERVTINNLYKLLQVYSKNLTEPIYREARQGDIEHSLADITKAKSMFGYNPQISVSEGLKETFNWFKEEFKTT